VSIAVAETVLSELALGVCLIITADGEVEGCEAEARCSRMGSLRANDGYDGAGWEGRFKVAK
jgi:hypothetical protein